MTDKEKPVLMGGVKTEAKKKEFSKIYRQQYAEAQELFRRFTDQSGDSEQNRVQILADDVGFGKTWVAMILLFGLLSSGKIPRHALIIAPNDLLAHKWIKELRTFMKDYVKGAEAFSVERIRGAEYFAERLRGLDEAADKRVRTIGTLLDRHQLGFVAFCLIQYEQVTQFLTRAIPRTAEEDKKKSAAYKLKHWLDRKLVREQAGEFNRFFSQDEAVNIVRFLRRWMILRGKKWLDKDETTETFDIDAESLEEALELKKGAKFAKFIDRVVTALDLNKEKIRVETPTRINGCRNITELAGKVLRCLAADNADGRKAKEAVTDIERQRWQRENEAWFHGRHSFSHHIFVLSRNDIGEFTHSNRWRSKFLVIVDEAHNWRKPDNKAPRCYSEYWKDLCRYALLLTATPLQLNAAELTSILRLFSDDATAERMQWEATLGEAIRQQEAILAAWEDLDTVDSRYLVAKAKEFADRFGAEPSQNQQRSFWKSLESAESQRLAALSRQVLKFDEFLQGGIREKLSRNLIKNRMDKNRSVYCGNDVESLADSADAVRKYFYRTKGITNTASLFNFICMRASAEADVSTDETQQRKPRLLRGWTSSFAALEDSAEWQKSGEKGGVYEKAQLNELLTKASHPKVSVTVKTICDSLLGDADHPGEKVVVFCERLRTVDDIKNKVEEGIREKIRALALEQGLSEARIMEIYDANLTESDSDANAEDREEQQNQSCQKALWAAAQNLAQRIWPGMPFPDRDNLMVPQEKYDTRPFLAFWYVTDLLKDKGEKKVSLRVEQVEDAYFDLMRSVIPAKDAQEYDDADPVTDAVAALTGDGTDQNERPWLLRGFSSPGFPLALICSQISQEGVDMHTYCRRIVLHDLNWNPAKLEQRIGRVDRRGSYALKNRKKVEVYVPFMADSYEEYQYERVLERSAMQELYFGCNDLLELNEEGKGKGKARAEDSDNKDDTSVPALADIGPLIKGLFDMDFSVKVKNGERKKNAA